MAVHGTRRGESVSWDYEGLLQLLSGLARERSGLPLLRCYWYETTVDGRRTAEQDALADLPGIKLRMAKIRPGRREGVETEIHRDLTTLARNNAISDALVVSAEEDLAQVIADVQDLGMRVTLVHIAVDGNWTIARALRQESDDIIEISGDHLRPYVELIAGAEPAQPDPDADLAAAWPLANGHASAAAASYQGVPVASGNHAPPAIYTAPVVAEYQRPAPQLPRTAAHEAREPRDGLDTREERSREDRQEPVPPSQAARARAAEEAVGYAPDPGAQIAGPEPGQAAPGAEAAPGPGQLRRLPSSRNPANQGQPGPAGVAGYSGSSPVPSGQHAGQGPAHSAPYSGPQPVLSPAATPGYQNGNAPASGGGVSLSEAVQVAHEEGQEFGGSVAREAPTLWLEAVLARKPRMPSDLEARLLQGSALPIDFLLHDEVRHALRRGFWDALERTRR